MGTTKIEWTDGTWNPVTGCTKISAGCAHCYAEIMASRLRAMGSAKYKSGFEPALHEEALGEPLHWKKPFSIFVCSMSDLFHDAVPFPFVDRVMDTVRESGRHRYQILTKRPSRMTEYFSSRPVPENVWLGVTVEARSEAWRADLLRRLPASVRFLSCEPLLEDLGDIDLEGIDWIIAGGESGPRARPMCPDWARSLFFRATECGIPFFFKQWGTWGPDGMRRNKGANGSSLDGRAIRMQPRPRKGRF
jgi:protein gp37